MPCQGQIRTWGAWKEFKRHGNDKVFIAALTSDIVCTLKKAVLYRKSNRWLMQIPMGEGVAAGNGVGERVVGGAVVAAMETW